MIDENRDESIDESIDENIYNIININENGDFDLSYIFRLCSSLILTNLLHYLHNFTQML